MLIKMRVIAYLENKIFLQSVQKGPGEAVACQGQGPEEQRHGQGKHRGGAIGKRSGAR